MQTGTKVPYQLHCCLKGLLDELDEATDELDEATLDLLDELTTELELELLGATELLRLDDLELELLAIELETDELERLLATEELELVATDELELVTTPALSPQRTPRPLVPI